MTLRDMPDAGGGDDMGGNPLKEGILADGGFKNRQVRDESFASVRSKISLFETPEFETTQIVAPPDLYRHGLETEAAHRTGIQIPQGITDNLHAALGNLGAWVDNPYENSQLRPYNQYWKVIRPSFMKPGSLRIGVADPTMAEIINHVAQTDDLTPLYEYQGRTSHAKTAGPLLAMLPEGLTALFGAGAAGATDATAAAATDAAATAGGADAAASAGASEAAGGAAGGTLQQLYNSPAGKGVRGLQLMNDVQNAPGNLENLMGMGQGAGGVGSGGMPAEPTSFYSRRLALFGELLEGLGGGAKAAEGVAEAPAKVPAPAIGGLMKKLVVPLGMSDDVMGLGAGQGGSGTNNVGVPQGSSFFSRSASDEDDMYPSSHDEIPKNEDGDHKQQDDGNNHEWQRDISVNGGGGTEHSPSFDVAGPGFQRLMMLAPLLLQFLDSGQDASHDPLVHGLHESFESELPGYLDHADDDAGQHLVMILRGAPGESAKAEPEKNEETHTDENSGGEHESKTASLTTGHVDGGDFLPDLDCSPPALNGMRRQANPDLYEIAELRQGLPADVQAEIDRVIRFEGVGAALQYLHAMTRSPQSAPGGEGSPYWDSMFDRVAKTAVTQGPNTPEQIQAVQQWLIDHGADIGLQGEELTQTVLSVPTNPLEFADVLAQVQQAEPPPQPPQDAGMSANPPAPAQENAPPEATMPMPGMKQQMMAAIKRYTADSIAGVCPDCGGHTTALMDQEDGTSQCHGCGKVFKTEGIADKVHPGQSTASTTYEAADHNGTPDTAHMIDDGPVQGVPIADQQGQHDLREEQDSGHTWADEDGNPLKVGSQYEMYSGKYDIPDLVRIEAVRPSSLTYTLTGEFGIEHSTELTKEEADLERVSFDPSPGSDQGLDDGLEFNNDDHTAFEGAPERTDSSAPAGLVSHVADRQVRASGVVTENPALAWLMQGVPKTAGANYTPYEQRELIDESGIARNSDMLALGGTHYLQDADEDQFLFGY